MNDFSKLVKKCSKNLENHTIFNASKDHAAILFNNLLDVSKREKESIKIFSGCYEADFYNKFVKDITEILNNDIKVELLAECKQEELHNNEFFNIVRKHKNGSVGCIKKQSYPHFIIVGNSRYRIETDDQKKVARANFNDPINGETIVSMFNNLSSESTAIMG